MISKKSLLANSFSNGKYSENTTKCTKILRKFRKNDKEKNLENCGKKHYTIMGFIKMR